MSIKHLAEDDRPREKFLNKGKQALSDSELLAIIMGSGNRERTAVELAREILSHFQNNWNNLSEASVPELMRFKGVGEAKAISIATALEIGKRRAQQEVPKRVQIQSSKQVFSMMSPLMSDLPREEFWVILLNQSNRVIHKIPLFAGGISTAVVDLRLLFKTVLEYYATAIILVHNHPSGNKNPSEEDFTLTKKVQEAGLFLDINLLDHIIIAKDDYFSFKDSALL